ncbi:MAG TPA: hypothetical protein VIN61_11935 [Gammaproteobacteria bacterium]
MAAVARTPGKLVALGEYAVLDGAEALVLAVDRYCEAAVERSTDEECRLEIRAGDTRTLRFAPGQASGVPLVDLVTGAPAAPAWRGRIDSSAFYAGGRKLGLGSSAAALCAWAGAWRAYETTVGGRTQPPLTLERLIDLHQRFQGGGSGLDVAASLHGGALTFAAKRDGSVRVGSVRLPNGVGFAGIFAGQSASTPELIARYAAWKQGRPAEAADRIRALAAIAAAGCAAAREDDARRFLDAIDAYGAALAELGTAIGADIVTADHRAIGVEARKYGVAYKVSGAGGGDLGIAFAADVGALDAFCAALTERNFLTIGLRLAEHGLVIEEREQ